VPFGDGWNGLVFLGGSNANGGKLLKIKTQSNGKGAIMYLKAEEAEREMEAAAKLNPGPWVEHVRSAAAAGQKIAAACGLNEEKAYSVILTHDIGRRFGRMGMRHVYLGWQYMTELGADENAQICLSHSFPDKDMENGFGDWHAGLPVVLMPG